MAAPLRTRGGNVEQFLARYLRHTKGSRAGQPFLLEPWQREFIRDFYSIDARGRRVYRLGLLGIPRGNGKALALDTPVATPSGWSTMGELQVGDEVFSPDGASTRVLAATVPLLGRDCYRVELGTGEEVVADAHHLWLTEEPHRNNVPMLRRTWEIGDTLLMSVPRAGRMWSERRHKVRLPGALQLPHSPLPVAPYVLGVWLGDGDSDSGRITAPEPELVSHVAACGYSVEPRVGGVGRHLVRGVQPQLRALGVLYDKHVPVSYLRASAGQRLELLQGLMDSDGTISKKRSQCEFSSTRERLARDVLELAATLGLRATIREGRAMLEGREVGRKYRVCFTPGELPVFKLQRKLARQGQSTDRVRTSAIVGCEPVDSVPVRCITVDRPDGMFLVGRTLIPTHNSPLAAGCGLYELVSRRDSPDVFCAAGSRKQAGVVMDFARAFVHSGDLHTQLKAGVRSIRRDETGGVMRVLSSEGALQYGLSVSAAVADELHAFATEAQEEVWNAILTALHKRVDSFALGISQAGYNKRTLLGRMYDEALELTDGEDRFDGCLRIRRDVVNGILFYWYGIPEHLEAEWENEELWRIVNPASWLSIETLRQQLAALAFDELDFKRLHLSMWTKARDSWLPANVWNGLVIDVGDEIAAEKRPAARAKALDAVIPAGADVYLGVDVGYYHDSSAVVLAHRVKGGDLDGRIALRAHVWTTKEEDPRHTFVAGGKMQLSLIREHIDALARKYRIRKIGFDPKYFLPVAEELDRRGLQTVEFIPSSSPMNEAYNSFYRGVMEATVVHDADPVLTAHVEATAADKAEGGWRIRKLRATNRIDATVAAAMAHALCEIHGRRGGPPKIYWIDE